MEATCARGLFLIKIKREHPLVGEHGIGHCQRFAVGVTFPVRHQIIRMPESLFNIGLHGGDVSIFGLPVLSFFRFSTLFCLFDRANIPGIPQQDPQPRGQVIPELFRTYYNDILRKSEYKAGDRLIIMHGYL